MWARQINNIRFIIIKYSISLKIVVHSMQGVRVELKLFHSTYFSAWHPTSSSRYINLLKITALQNYSILAGQKKCFFLQNLMHFNNW